MQVICGHRWYSRHSYKRINSWEHKDRSNRRQRLRFKEVNGKGIYSKDKEVHRILICQSSNQKVNQDFKMWLRRMLKDFPQVA